MDWIRATEISKGMSSPILGSFKLPLAFKSVLTENGAAAEYGTSKVEFVFHLSFFMIYHAVAPIATKAVTAPAMLRI